MADMVLVVAELDDGGARKITLEAVTAAREIAEAKGYDVAVAALGSGLDGDALAETFGALGVETLYLLDDEALEPYTSEAHAAALQQLIEGEGPEVVLFGMTLTGRDLAPRLAAKLEAGLASDITAIEVEDDELILSRPIYSGQLIAKTRVSSTPLLATIRPNTWPAAQPSGGDSAEVEEVDLDDLPEPRVELLEVEASGGDRPSLADASIVVAAGRGIGNPENFALVEELADLLGAAVGTTRAVVDAGWRPYDEQVGQTGKTVSPKLYIALGISGALQHLSGMRTSKTIVAINKDADAPIFRIADYGLVADLFTVLPLLKQEIQALK